LLRHDIRDPGKISWSIAYYPWLSTLNFDAGATQTAFTEYWHTRLRPLTRESSG